LAAAVHEPGRVRVRRLHRRWWPAPTSLLAQREHAALDELVAGRTVGRDAEAAVRAARGVARILARDEPAALVAAIKGVQVNARGGKLLLLAGTDRTVRSPLERDQVVGQAIRASCDLRRG